MTKTKNIKTTSKNINAEGQRTRSSDKILLFNKKYHKSILIALDTEFKVFEIFSVFLCVLRGASALNLFWLQQKATQINIEPKISEVVDCWIGFYYRTE